LIALTPALYPYAYSAEQEAEPVGGFFRVVST